MLCDFGRREVAVLTGSVRKCVDPKTLGILYDRGVTFCYVFSK